MAVWITWFLYTSPHSFNVFLDNWKVSLTMVFGSLIAGATSAGGGVIAFPVFTKVLQILPSDAKVFSLAIQSVGMVAATFTLIILRVTVAWKFIVLASLGGLGGIYLGAVVIAPHIPADVVKMLFTSIIASFALTLLLVKWKKRGYNNNLSELRLQDKAIIVFSGIIGGIISGMIGNGIDLICFSVMVLLFRLSEKIATPTSVILMAFNSLAGFALHVFVIGGFTEQVKAYWLAAIPVVVVGAPLGAYLCTQLSNKTIAFVLIVLIMLEIISSLSLIPLNDQIIKVSLAIFLLFSVIYFQMSRITYKGN